jgi:hypothetical protein
MEKHIFKCAHTDIIPLKQLKEHPDNPNKHSRAQIAALAHIIQYAGQRKPITVSNRSGLITSGHGRLKALRKLKWNRAAVDFQDYESLEEEIQDMIADNEIARWAVTDEEKMNILSMDLPDDFDYALLGLKDMTIPEVPESRPRGPSSVTCPECGHDFER